MMVFVRTTIQVLCVLGCGLGAVYGDPIPLQIRSRALDEGACTSIEQSGSLILLGAGNNLVALDGSTEPPYQRLSKVATSGVIWTMKVLNNYAYLANDAAGLTIIDIHDSLSVDTVGFYVTPTRVFDLDIRGNYAFLARKGFGLDIIDITDVRNPEHFSSYVDPRLDANLVFSSIQVTDTRAYLVDMTGVSVLNIENLSAPTLIGYYSMRAWDILLQDTLAFLTTNEEGDLRVFDIANPDTMLLLSSIGVASPALRVSANSDRAFVACERGGMVIVDITDPRAMRVAVRIDSLNQLDVQNSVVRDDILHFVSYADGVYSFPATDSIEAHAVPSYLAGNSPQRIDVWNNTLFVANYYKGVTAVDFSRPLFPVELFSSAPVGGAYPYTTGVAAFQRIDSLYVTTADNTAGIRILQVMEDDSFRFIKRKQVSEAEAIVVEGNFAYVVADTRLVVCDYSDLNNPLLYPVDMPGRRCTNLVVQDGFAYVTCREYGMVVVDVQDPAHLEIVNEARYTDIADIDVSYPFAYGLVNEEALTVVDVSTNPPTFRGTYVLREDNSSIPTSIRVEQPYAFVTISHKGLVVVDVSRPDSMYVKAYCDETGYSGDAIIVEDSSFFRGRRTAFVASPTGGVMSMDVTALFDTTRTSLVISGGGNDPENARYFYENTNPSTNFAYGVIAGMRQYASYLGYMNPAGWQDLTGNGQDDRIVHTSTMTPDNLRDQILYLRDSENPEFPNVIFFSGHGHVDALDINGDPQQNVSADSLGAWIDRANLDETTPLVIVIEACNSGSLIEELSRGSNNRVFIASSRADEISYIDRGECFSTIFWERVWNGVNVWDAFDSASAWAAANSLSQNPMLDADGNGVPNEVGDRTIARGIVIGGSSDGGATLPVILDSPVGVNAVHDTATAVIRLNGSMEKVWYRLLPLDRPFDANSVVQAEMLSIGDSRYVAELSGLNQLLPNTDYVIEFNALDDYVNYALPKVAALWTADHPEPPLVEEWTLQSFPNPFNTNTRITFFAPTQGNVKLDVWNILGQRVASLADEDFGRGAHTIYWDGNNASGYPLTSGVYFVSLRAGSTLRVFKSLLLR